MTSTKPVKKAKQEGAATYNGKENKLMPAPFTTLASLLQTRQGTTTNF
jgi:hypothetical protein